MTVFADADADGVRDAGEAASAGVQVRLLTTTGTQVMAATTGADGTAALSPARGSYDVEVVAPAGSVLVGAAKRRVDLTADGAVVALAVGVTSTSGVRTVVFEDLDGDGVRDAGEAGSGGWSVTLTGASTVPAGVTAADGTLTFPGVPAGSWSARVAARPGWRTTTTLPLAVTVDASGADVAIGVARTPGFSVRVVDDLDGDGTLDEGEGDVTGLVVQMSPTGGTAVEARTGAEGVVLDAGNRTSTVRALLPDTGLPFGCTAALVTTPSGTTSVACGADGTVAVPADAAAVTLLGAFTSGVVTTELFDDADRDGVRDVGEAPLADWPVALVTTTDHVEVARSTTDEEGLAGLVAVPGRYEVVPQPPTATVPWTNTDGSYDVEVVRGRGVTSVGGWVQPGSLSVGAFHDLDKDGVREAGDVPLVDRTVTLLNAAGTTTLATGYTDGTGRLAFPVQAGTSYKVRMTVPTGWQATAPRSGTTVQTTVSVTAPADGGQATVEVGHYNTVDRVAPAAPAFSLPGGALAASALVTITGETGATIRYTLDGTEPTATRGMVYATPVRISMNRVLRAVAIDAAGNVSTDAAASYTLPWTGVTKALPSSAWTVTSGGLPRGGVAETTADDGRLLAVASGLVAARPTVDVTTTIQVPADLRAAAAVNVSASLRTTLRATRVRVQWLDQLDPAVPTWRALTTATQGLDESKLDVDLGAIKRLLDANGNVQLRFIADNGKPFDLQVDQVALTVVNRR